MRITRWLTPQSVSVTVEPEEIRHKAAEARRLRQMHADGKYSDEEWVVIRNKLESIGLLNPMMVNIAEMAGAVGQKAFTWKVFGSFILFLRAEECLVR
eukprot:6872808-Pyramimonas_sp.AAC.1